MSNAKPSKPAKLPSMADYIVHHDIASMLAEARMDYNEASAGAPRHLNQKDISARFTIPPLRRPDKTSHE